MKKSVVSAAVFAALALVDPANAADMLTKAPIYKAPPAPVRAFTWTGCYIGGHVGWGWGRKTFTDTPDSGLVSAFTSSSSLDVNTDGFLGGGQIGCDYQFDPRWVVGVEGQFSGADISGSESASNTIVISDLPTTLAGSFHAKTDWLASATARLGYAWDPRWLLYVKGGAAWAHDKYDISFAVSGVVTETGTLSASETRSGWTIGGGLEWAFADHWSTKLEYQYYDFGIRDVTFAGNVTVNTVTVAATEVENVKQQIHTVKLGVNYRF